MTASEMVAYALRLPADLKAQLTASATANKRSLNSEIIIRLQRSFEGWKQ